MLGTIPSQCPASEHASQPPAMRDKIPIAVLGDSDSHSYHDTVLIDPHRRGGARYRPVTYQWTEVLHELRSDQVDFGAWGVWGTGRTVARLGRLVGQRWRVPRKEDFEYNLAWSGAECADLTEGPGAQADTLVRIIERDPGLWDGGVVVVKIGINSLQTPEQLEEYAASGLNEEAARRVAACVGHISASVEAIRSTSARPGIALVGLFEEPNWVPLVDRWQTADAIANIRAVLDHFDGELERLSRSDDAAVFVDDRQWWKEHWGDRDQLGIPHYRAVSLGGATAVTNTQGDSPVNAVLADGHAGTVQNGLWARHLVGKLNAAFGLELDPPRDAEIAGLADPDGRLGLSPPKAGPGTDVP